MLPRLSLILMLCLPLLAFGAVEVHTFDNPEQEAQYRQLIEELRCLVCQNQNLEDSNADLARDLRQEIYEMLRKGYDRKQIITFMTDRYGDFVLYRPPLKPSTMLLWAGPFLFMIIAIVVLLAYIRRHQTPPASKMDEGAVHEKARQLLEDKES